jgi:hypothetical protein
LEEALMEGYGVGHTLTGTDHGEKQVWYCALTLQLAQSASVMSESVIWFCGEAEKNTPFSPTQTA